jgi:hypothetical protein
VLKVLSYANLSAASWTGAIRQFHHICLWLTTNKSLKALE